MVSVDVKQHSTNGLRVIVQELCESRGGRPRLSVLTSLLVSVDVKLYIEPCFGIGLSLSLICQPTSEDIKQHLKEAYQAELRRCVKVEVAVLGFRALICLTVSVDVKQH